MKTQKLTCSITQHPNLSTNHSMQTIPPSICFNNYLTYQLASIANKTIRKYHIYCENVKSFLQTTQFRKSGSKQIAKCFYTNVNEENNSNTGSWVELYTEHMELLLKDMDKLIVSEVIYFLINCLQGYYDLLLKYERISINSETIGLNPEGQCIVWINRHLQQCYPQYYTICDEATIIKTVIRHLKEKGEKQSKKILSKIQQFTMKKQKIRDVLNYCHSLTKIRGIKLPQNLNYLIKQNRIMKQLQKLQGQKTIRHKQSTRNSAFCVLPSFQSHQFLKTRKFSMAKQNQQRENKHLNQISKYMKRSYNKEISRKSFQKLKIKTQSASQDKYIFNSHFKQKSINSFNSRQSFSRSHSKSKEKCINVINKLKNNSNSESRQKISARPLSYYQPLKLSKTSQIQTVSSLTESDKHQTLKLCRRRTYQKISKTHNSILSNLSGKSKDQIVPEQQQSFESSPQKDNLSNNYHKQDTIQLNKISFGPNSGQKDEIFKNNNWRKNFNELLSLESNVVSSIIQGPQKYAYLQEVKLQRLDKLNRHLAQSRTPSSQILIEYEDSQ